VAAVVLEQLTELLWIECHL